MFKRAFSQTVGLHSRLLKRHCQLCNLQPAMPDMQMCQDCFADMPLTGHTAHHGANFGIRAACDYAFPITELIFAYKYAGNLAFKPLLVDLLLTLPKPAKNTLLVPMPSSSARLKSRGFDHIYLLTKRLAKQWQLPLWQGVKRTGDAPQQKGLSREQRLENIQGQFVLTQQPPVGHVLLMIDDVCTTGSTLTALAKCLAESGLTVNAYVIAHKQYA